eukprot:TRINITY_DN97037_c0_g1_i1.p1 TRINITY_DN97037_c0_g1~~TRINITY_DN97037_c0_g1_i1.p1  ORF type:complete len:222 (+),score=42.85 TRINITY_DN97037_c0_g1_i1:33-698(+)
MALHSSNAPEKDAEPVPAGTLRLVGVPASPYSRKVLAVLRYRRIPYRWITRGSADDKGLRDAPGPPLLPNLILEDGEAMADSTPILKRLEAKVNGRSIYPPHLGLNFLNLILEDYADEWTTKHMFHYRWWYKLDAKKSGRILPLLAKYTMPEETYQQFEHGFVERQTGRLAMVTGSNETTASVIEASYKSLITKLNDHLQAEFPFFLAIDHQQPILLCLVS